MNRIGIILAGLMIIVFISTMEIAAENTGNDVMCIPMGNILLEPPESVEAKKASVNFPHSTHFIFDCKTCHHKWKGESQIVGCSTSGCHDLEKSPKKTKKDLMSKYYKTAFHKQCIGCHKKMKIKNKKMEMSYAVIKTPLPKTGPTGCVKCHPKQ